MVQIELDILNFQQLLTCCWIKVIKCCLYSLLISGADVLCYDFEAISTGHQLEKHLSLRQPSKAAHLCVVCWDLHPQVMVQVIGNGHQETYWFGGVPTPLKNDGVRQLGWWTSQYTEKNVPNHQPAYTFPRKGWCSNFINVQISRFHPKILLPDSLSWKKCTVSLPLFSQNERKTNVHHHSLTLYMFRSTLIIIIIN